MSGTQTYFTLMLFLFLAVHSSAAPSSGTTSDEAFQELRSVVDQSRNASSYRLDVNFKIDVSDREDPITFQSEGVFQSPYYRLRSETPSGMQVKSFGKDEKVLHIHPSTDEIVTSRRLGISSVNRTLLDPFQHMAYLLDPEYEQVSVTRKKAERVDGDEMEVLRVEVGTEPVRDVMKEFGDQLRRPLKPEKTTAVYRIFYDPTSKQIRRIQLTADSEFVKQDNPRGQDDWKEGLPKPEGGGKQEEGPVQMHVEATFDLTEYGAVSDVGIPSDVHRMLDQKN